MAWSSRLHLTSSPLWAARACPAAAPHAVGPRVCGAVLAAAAAHTSPSLRGRQIQLAPTAPWPTSLRSQTRTPAWQSTTVTEVLVEPTGTSLAARAYPHRSSPPSMLWRGTPSTTANILTATLVGVRTPSPTEWKLEES